MPIPLKLSRNIFTAVVLGMLWANAVHAEDLLTSQMVDEARMWQSKGRMDLAEDIWRRLLITNARNGAALVGLAQIQIKAGRLDEAQALLSRAARLTPSPTALASVISQLRSAQQRSSTASETVARNSTTASASPAAPLTAKPAPPFQPNASVSGSVALPSAPLKSPSTAAHNKTSAQTPAPAPVPPRPVEVTVTPIPFRTVIAAPSRGNDDTPESMQLQASNQLMLGSTTGAASIPAAPSPLKKNKPRPCRPAPATNPPLPER